MSPEESCFPCLRRSYANASWSPSPCFLPQPGWGGKRRLRQWRPENRTRAFHSGRTQKNEGRQWSSRCRKQQFFALRRSRRWRNCGIVQTDSSEASSSIDDEEGSNASARSGVFVGERERRSDAHVRMPETVKLTGTCESIGYHPSSR